MILTKTIFIYLYVSIVFHVISIYMCCQNLTWYNSQAACLKNMQNQDVVTLKKDMLQQYIEIEVLAKWRIPTLKQNELYM